MISASGAPGDTWAVSRAGGWKKKVTFILNAGKASDRRAGTHAALVAYSRTHIA